MSLTNRNFEGSPEAELANEVYGRALDYQAYIDSLGDEASGHITNLRDQVAEELDTTFPYIGRQVYMSGYGLLIDCDELFLDNGTLNPLGRVGQYWEMTDGFLGFHDGFAIIPDERGKYQVMHKVLVGDIEIESGVRGGWDVGLTHSMSCHSYLDLASSCLVVDDIESIYASPHDDLPLKDKLMWFSKHAKDVDRLLRQSGFWRDGRECQERRLINIGRTAELSTGLREEELTIFDPAVYVLRDEHLTRLSSEKPLIGTCLGLTVLELFKLKQGEGLRSDSDLIDGGIGLSLVVSPLGSSKHQLGLSDDENILYVGLSPDVHIEAYPT